jgi:two-component system, OmpR family, response regulator
MLRYRSLPEHLASAALPDAADIRATWRSIVAENGGSRSCDPGALTRNTQPVACAVMKRQVAIVEDEPAIRDNYAAAFTREGYVVRAYGNRKQAMAAFAARLPDLAVIDISLEEEPEGGFELCRQLRALSPELPIIFLTARDSELDAVSGLRLGADDFLTKDLSLAHLIARVNALFRRVDALRKPSETSQVIRRGPLTLDGERMQVEWEGQVVLLSLTEFWIVHALARNPGHVKNRQQLMDAANVVLDDNTITSHVKRIRRKFQSIDPTFDAVQTVYGMGYRWVE